MTANISMPFVTNEKKAQVGKVFAEVNTASEIYQYLTQILIR